MRTLPGFRNLSQLKPFLVCAALVASISACSDLGKQQDADPASSTPPGELTVRVDQPGHNISPMLYGLMTEEINHSYDGGLYAELIQNRIFKDDGQKPAHWAAVNGARR